MKYTDYHDIKTHKKSLRDCSYDSAHNESMSQSDLVVIDFDAVKTSYLSQMGYSEEKAHSVDSLAYKKDGSACFIEFKNGDVKKEKTKINLKIRDSVLMLCDICRCRVSDTRKDVEFVLVYNEEHAGLTYQDKRALHSAIVANRSCPLLELDKAEGFLVKKVLVMNKEEFDEKLAKELVGL